MGGNHPRSHPNRYSGHKWAKLSLITTRQLSLDRYYFPWCSIASDSTWQWQTNRLSRQLQKWWRFQCHHSVLIASTISSLCPKRPNLWLRALLVYHSQVASGRTVAKRQLIIIVGVASVGGIVSAHVTKIWKVCKSYYHLSFRLAHSSLKLAFVISRIVSIAF